MNTKKKGEESTLKEIGILVLCGVMFVLVIASALTKTVSAELECVGSRCRVAHTSRIGTTSYGDVFDVSQITRVERRYYQSSNRSNRRGLSKDDKYYITVTMPGEYSGSTVSESMGEELVDPLIQRINRMRAMGGR
ncbi:hypothetical protein DV096_16780 [Bradymonadaceae bacterium TMQ3]|nr:hypothetical protein DV096_16780 [Bradymonadaceae bacterium TMQ3]